MVNPAFSESQLKNLRRQNRHLVSTHRRKLVFLQASRNPAHGSGRPFFVRDVPVPASFCPAFAPPAPASAAPAVPPSPPLLPSSSSLSRTPDRVRIRSMRAAVPLPCSAPRERSRPASFCPAPVASAFAPPAPVSAAPSVLPSSPLLPSSSSLSRTPDRVRIRSMRAAVPLPCSAPRERSRPASFCPAPVASAFAPPAPVSAAPQLRPFHRPRRSVPSSPSRSRTPDKVRVCTVHAAVPHPHPARRERSLRHLSARPLSLRPSPLRLPLPPLPSSDRSAVPSASALVFQPLPHAGQSSVPYCACCRSASPPESRERSRPASFCPAPVASAFAPPAPVSAAPQLRPFHRPRRSVPSSPSRSRTPDKVRVCTVHAAVPHPHPARRERSLRHLSVRPSPLRLPALAAPQLRPFRRPLRFCPRLPASPARRTELGFVLCALPFRIPARHPGNGPVPASFYSAFAPPAPVSAAPQLRPFCRPHRFCPRLPASPARRTEFGSVLYALPFRIPAGIPGTVPPGIFLPGPCRFGLRPSGSRFRSSAPSPRRPAEPAAPSARHAKRAV